MPEDGVKIHPKGWIDRVMPWGIGILLAGLGNLYMDVNTLKATRAQIVEDVTEIKADVKEFKRDFQQFLLDEARSGP